MMHHAKKPRHPYPAKDLAEGIGTKCCVRSLAIKPPTVQGAIAYHKSRDGQTEKRPHGAGRVADRTMFRTNPQNAPGSEDHHGRCTIGVQPAASASFVGS
jgi:hypothetical protein